MINDTVSIFKSRFKNDLFWRAFLMDYIFSLRLKVQIKCSIQSYTKQLVCFDHSDVLMVECDSLCPRVPVFTSYSPF